MKTKLDHHTQRPSGTIRSPFTTNLKLARMGTFVFLTLLTFNLRAQTDNFDTGTATGWLHITATNYPATYSFPTNAAIGGYAYRLQGIRPAGFIDGEQVGTNTARVTAWRPDRLYTNFYVAADIVAWGAPNDTNGNIFGIFGRGVDLASGRGTAVTLIANPNRWYKGQGSSRGAAYVYSFALGHDATPAAFVTYCTLVPGRAYRFVLTGVSNTFTGSIYDLEDLTRPLASMRGDDRFIDYYHFPPYTWPTNISGYSGIFNISDASERADEDQTTDTAFDNFVAAEAPPTSVSLPGTPHGVAGVAQVVNRSPISFTNFYPASGGIAFNATTLTTTNTVNTNAIKLFLNGVDVSASLSIIGPTTNASVAYSGLASNAVYDARIELQDALGRKTTNVWTFDTFSDAYLANVGASNIEAEDYDFSSGQFIPDPLPSGYATNAPATIINYGTGYVGQQGTFTVDFFDYDGGPNNNEKDFRVLDRVGTQQGNFADSASTIDGDPSDPNGLFPVRAYEVQRQKYINVDPALHEYIVRRTDGGEWLNYTRVFTNTSYYNVYLRHACGGPQYLSLDQITPGPATNNLGTFTLPSYTTLLNYRYAPLHDNSGKLAVVNLSGTNTLRLTVAPPAINVKKWNLTLNYLAFVPALLVESSPQATGPYAIEPGAIAEPGTRRVTIPTSGSKHFYRLRWDHQVTITNVKLAGDNVELTYQ